MTVPLQQRIKLFNPLRWVFLCLLTDGGGGGGGKKALSLKSVTHILQ